MVGKAFRFSFPSKTPAIPTFHWRKQPMSTAEAPAKGEYQYGFHDPTDKYAFTSRKGLDAEMVAMISEMKNEPDWMREFRLHSYELFESKPMPTWGGDMSGIDFQNIYYYVKA